MKTKIFIKGYRGEVQLLADLATTVTRISSEHDVISFGGAFNNEVLLKKEKFLELFSRNKNLKATHYINHVQFRVMVNNTLFSCIVFEDDPEYELLKEAMNEFSPKV